MVLIIHCTDTGAYILSISIQPSHLEGGKPCSSVQHMLDTVLAQQQRLTICFASAIHGDALCRSGRSMKHYNHH